MSPRSTLWEHNIFLSEKQNLTPIDCNTYAPLCSSKNYSQMNGKVIFCRKHDRIQKLPMPPVKVSLYGRFCVLSVSFVHKQHLVVNWGKWKWCESEKSFIINKNWEAFSVLLLFVGDQVISAHYILCPCVLDERFRREIIFIAWTATVPNVIF